MFGLLGMLYKKLRQQSRKKCLRGSSYTRHLLLRSDPRGSLYMWCWYLLLRSDLRGSLRKPPRSRFFLLGRTVPRTQFSLRLGADLRGMGYNQSPGRRRRRYLGGIQDRRLH